MNNKTTFHRWASLALTLLLCVLSAMAQKDTRRKAADGVPPSKGAPLAIKKADGKTKMAYALMGFDYQQNSLKNFLVQFPFTNGATFTPVIKMCDGGYDLTAGAYADGYYYAERTQTDANGIMMPVELVCYDIERNQLSTVGPLSGFTSHINDMTYDYSTGTMYAISTYENAYSNLFTIDLGNAKSKVVASLDRRFFTLACTYDGQLYGISFNGDFCKIDKNTGAVEVIGATGWHPNYYQSMEFDHTDGTLYWAANLKEGVGETDCIASVDLATGAATSVAVIGSLPQLGGLYIPFSASAKGTPAALDNFDVVADANGATKATLSWTNPTKTFDGQDLSAITNVMIMRDHEPIATITDAQPGKPMQYVDNLGDVKGAIHHYTAYATNSVGNGAEVRTSLFIGHAVGSLVQPLFAQGKLRAQYKIAKIEQESLTLDFRNTLLSAGQEVSDALSAYQTAIAKAEKRQLEVEQLEQALDKTLFLFSHGNTTSYLETLTAQQSLLSAQLSLISDKYDKLQAGISLYQALGGGRDK